MGDRIEAGGQGRITSAERASLLVLIRQRERVAKADVQERAAVMLADFERKLAAIYYPEDHPAWKAAHEAAKAAVADARERVAEVCRDLGIPKAFAPDLSAGWYGRGANASRAPRRTAPSRQSRNRRERQERAGGHRPGVRRVSDPHRQRRPDERSRSCAPDRTAEARAIAAAARPAIARAHRRAVKDRYGQPLLSTETPGAAELN